MKKYSIPIFLILICILIYYFEIKIDITQDKKFSLTNSTKIILKNIDSNINIQLYYSKNLPADYKKLFNATIELLEVYRNINPDKISFQILQIDDAFPTDSLRNIFLDSLQDLGVQFDYVQESKGTTNRTNCIIPYIFIKYNESNLQIVDLKSSRRIFKLVDVLNDQYIEDKDATKNEAIALLEYKLTHSIYNLINKNKPVIAYLIGNGEPLDLRVYDLIESIKNDYNIAIFDLKKGFPNPDFINTLLIIKPTQTFTEADKYKLDQFKLHGGNIIWAIDKLYAEYDSLENSSGSYIAYDRKLELEDLFFNDGVRINDALVQDLNCAKIPIVVDTDNENRPIIQRLPWAYYPLLTSKNNHPIVTNIDKVLSIFPAYIDTIKKEGIQKTILLTTDSNSRIIASPAIVSLNSIKTEEDLFLFKKSYLPISVLVEGKFNSLYKYRNMSSLNELFFKATNKNYQTQGIKNSKQIFIADADILTNFVDPTKGPMEMGKMPFENYQFANRTFYLNALEYLSAQLPLYESRNKTFILRLLDKNKIDKNRNFYQFTLIILPIIFFITLTGILIWYKKYIFAKN